MRKSIKLSIGLITIILATSCSKKLSTGNTTPENRQGSILIQESHIDEINDLQVSAYFLDGKGEPQNIGILKINEQEVPITGRTYSGDGFSKSLVGKKSVISLYNNDGKVPIENTIYLAEAIHVEIPREVKLGTEMRWNVDERSKESMVEIKIRYHSGALYNDEQGFDKNQVTKRKRVNDSKGSFVLDESFFEEIPDGAWVNLSISRTVSQPGSFHYEEQEFPYLCRWLSTDLHTVRFMN